MSDGGQPWELGEFSRSGLATPQTEYGADRYFTYRRKGLAADEARLAALAWEANMAEQRRRRRQLDTGPSFEPAGLDDCPICGVGSGYNHVLDAHVAWQDAGDEATG